MSNNRIAASLMLLAVLAFSDIKAVMWLYRHDYARYRYVRYHSKEHKRLSDIIDSMNNADIHNVLRQYRKGVDKHER